MGRAYIEEYTRRVHTKCALLHMYSSVCTPPCVLFLYVLPLCVLFRVRSPRVYSFVCSSRVYTLLCVLSSMCTPGCVHNVCSLLYKQDSCVCALLCICSSRLCSSHVCFPPYPYVLFPFVLSSMCTSPCVFFPYILSSVCTSLCVLFPCDIPQCVRFFMYIFLCVYSSSCMYTLPCVYSSICTLLHMYTLSCV